MSEKPTLFNSSMVNAIQGGTKTQTRRHVDKLLGFGKITEFGKSDTPGYDWHFRNKRMLWNDLTHEELLAACPWGTVGDRLWVRETFATVNSEGGPALAYRADGTVRTWEEWSETFGKDYGYGPSMDYDTYPGEYIMWHSDLLAGEPGHCWTPSIHMPRWASRITLEITGVRVERLNEISEDDAIAEGIKQYDNGTFGLDSPSACMGPSATVAFMRLWESINGKSSWIANPFVWAVSFRRI